MLYSIVYKEELQHHGIKGQKWGVRRYQNEDGSWTGAGRQRYGKGGELRGNYETDADNEKNRTGISKGVKIGVSAGAAIAGVTMGVLAARKFNGEARIVSDLLREHGTKVISSIMGEAKLTEALNADEFEYNPYHGVGKALAKEINNGIREFGTKQRDASREMLLANAKTLGVDSMKKLSKTTLDQLGVYSKDRENTEIFMNYIKTVGKEMYLDPATEQIKGYYSKATEHYNDLSEKAIKALRKGLNLE